MTKPIEKRGRMAGVWVKLLAVAAAVALPGGAAAARAADPVLTGNVGQDDSYVISLADASGAPVRHLDPGSYTLVVHDHSSFHNFHLSGPGVDVSTDIDGVGDKTFTITITDGTYFFQCDPHFNRMRGSFTAGTVTAPPPPPAVQKLTAAIGPGKTFRLAPIASLAAGKATVKVTDRSATDGFRLSGPGISRSTGAAFKGTVTWTVTFKAGKYAYGSLRNPKLRRTAIISG